MSDVVRPKEPPDPPVPPVLPSSSQRTTPTSLPPNSSMSRASAGAQDRGYAQATEMSQEVKKQRSLKYISLNQKEIPDYK